MGRPELCWNFSSILKDDSDIDRFPTLHMTETHFLLENPSISESSLGILEKFQRSSGLPIIKYNCVVLFLDTCLVISLCCQIYFLIDHHCKLNQNWLICPK